MFIGSRQSKLFSTNHQHIPLLIFSTNSHILLNFPHIGYINIDAFFTGFLMLISENENWLVIYMVSEGSINWRNILNEILESEQAGGEREKEMVI